MTPGDWRTLSPNGLVSMGLLPWAVVAMAPTVSPSLIKTLNTTEYILEMSKVTRFL